MVSYFDTSVLFASVFPSHENHLKAVELIVEAEKSGIVVSTTLHTYAELYNNLTRLMPDNTRISPDQAFDLLVNRLGKRITFIELDRSDYVLALKRCTDFNLVRAIIYDALHVQAALKAEAGVLYTDNLRDFTRLVTEEDKIELKGIR